MHPYLSEALARMRIDELHRETAKLRFAQQVGRHRHKKARRSGPRITERSIGRPGGEQPCAES
jgi:hypothetical protein